ncbi:hypothetical protein [Mucilaginibacter sp. CSA2-8R]|uniref:hypothetical protein n=1 Tax=Mucilaginibacter sp. CSA2-8R TaxID=3141542 RepID=UPI00315D41B5
MSFLKQLLNPFVEFDEDKKPVSGAPAAAPVLVVPAATDGSEAVHHPLIPDTQTPAGTSVPVTSLPVPAPNPDMATEHQQYFDKLIEKANRENPLFAGADYKEFTDARRDIDDITDETVRYTTAFNILKSAGLTKDKLLSSGREYLNIIGRDLNAFQTAHAQLYKKELEQKELSLQTKVKELQQLTQRLTMLKAEINAATQEISQTKDILNKTRNSFLLAGEQKQHEIETELKKIAGFF